MEERPGPEEESLEIRLAVGSLLALIALWFLLPLLLPAEQTAPVKPRAQLISQR